MPDALRDRFVEPFKKPKEVSREMSNREGWVDLLKRYEDAVNYELKRRAEAANAP